jgi:hypothetical protein
MKNTIEKLKTLGYFDGVIGEREQAFAQAFETIIERSRSLIGPKAGDIIIKDGTRLHVESIQGDEISLCENYYTPFVNASIDGWGHCKVSMNTSGGPWSSINASALRIKHKGPKERVFQSFCGIPRGNGALEFVATVNVWEIDTH